MFIDKKLSRTRVNYNIIWNYRVTAETIFIFLAYERIRYTRPLVARSRKKNNFRDAVSVLERGLFSFRFVNILPPCTKSLTVDVEYTKTYALHRADKRNRIIFGHLRPRRNEFFSIFLFHLTKSYIYSLTTTFIYYYVIIYNNNVTVILFDITYIILYECCIINKTSRSLYLHYTDVYAYT